MKFYLIFSSILCQFPRGKWVFIFKISPSESGGGTWTVLATPKNVFVANSFYVYVYRVVWEGEGFPTHWPWRQRPWHQRILWFFLCLLLPQRFSPRPFLSLSLLLFRIPFTPPPEEKDRSIDDPPPGSKATTMAEDQIIPPSSSSSNILPFSSLSSADNSRGSGGR